MTILYRKAQHADWDVISQYAAEFYKGSGWQEILGKDANPSVGLEEWIDAPNIFFEVAEDGGKIVGGIGVALVQALTVRDMMLGQELFWYVAPAHRNSSVAIKLLKHALEWAKQSGASAFGISLLVGSMPDTVASIYERMGFVEVERIYVKELQNADIRGWGEQESRSGECRPAGGS